MVASLQITTRNTVEIRRFVGLFLCGWCVDQACVDDEYEITLGGLPQLQLRSPEGSLFELGNTHELSPFFHSFMLSSDWMDVV